MKYLRLRRAAGDRDRERDGDLLRSYDRDRERDLYQKEIKKKIFF